jgi:glycerol dehydrogenase-like iron-containing ADH family enzyme
MLQTNPTTTQHGATSSPPASLIRPGDRVLVFDNSTAMNVWIIVDDVLLGSGRTRLRSGNMEFYFDASLVIRHQKGGHRHV